MCKHCLVNQNLTKFAIYCALFPQVQGNAGQEIREPVMCKDVQTAAAAIRAVN
jgi:hypothetical protein